MAKKRKGYTTPEIAGIINLSIRKVISYVERGYICPSIQDSSGHGSKRIFSYEDLVEAFIVAMLDREGYKTKAIRKHIEKIRTGKGMRDDGLYVAKTMLSIQRGIGACALVIDISSIKRYLREKTDG